jgi:DNA-binding protein YbaB
MPAIQLRDTLTSYSEQRGTNGAAHILPYGVAGDHVMTVLVGKTTAPGANDVISTTLGFKAFEAMLAGAVAAPGTGDTVVEAVAIAWSTLEADHAGIATLLASAVTEYDAAPSTPPLLLANVKIIRTIDDIVTVAFDGETTIKTVGVRAVGVTPNQVNVLLNLVQ